MAGVRKTQALAGAASAEKEIHKARAARNRHLATAHKNGATFKEMRTATGLSVEGIRKAINLHNEGG